MFGNFGIVDPSKRLLILIAEVEIELFLSGVDEEVANGFHNIIDRHDLMRSIKSRWLKIIGGVVMTVHPYLVLGFFHKLALEALYGSFAKL